MGELDMELTGIKNKINPTEADVRKLDLLCKQISNIDTQISAEAIHERVQQPIGQGPILAPIGGQGSGDQTGFYRQFGEFLQATAAAAIPPGQRIGRFETGVIHREALKGAEYRSTGLEESTPSLGGFLVGQDQSAELFSKVRQTSILWDRVRQIEISANANSIKIPTVDESSRADGSRAGGLRAYWPGEGETKTASKPKFGQLELSLNKLAILIYSTDELLQDSVALGQYIATESAKEIGFKLDDAVLNGTGAGQPVGILNANALVTVAKEAGQVAATVVLDNIIKMWSRLWIGSRANSIWIANADVIPQLYQLSLSVGTGGAAMFLPSNAGATARPNDMLFGRPILYVEQAQTLGTLGDIYLVDLSQYVGITKGGIQAASSIHAEFAADETTFRFVYRCDGQPLWAEALTPYKGTGNTQSPFIALAVRA